MDCSAPHVETRIACWKKEFAERLHVASMRQAMPRVKLSPVPIFLGQDSTTEAWLTTFLSDSLSNDLILQGLPLPNPVLRDLEKDCSFSNVIDGLSCFWNDGWLFWCWNGLCNFDKLHALTGIFDCGFEAWGFGNFPLVLEHFDGFEQLRFRGVLENILPGRQL